MSRRYPMLTEADSRRLLGQQVMPPPEGGFSSVRQTETGYVLRYRDWLPRISGHQLNRYARSRLAKRGRLVFGELPPVLYPTQRARVEVMRVMGPRQKPMDRDSLAQWLAGLIDSLKPSYIRDDNEAWADITYQNDGSRRSQGPAIEIRIDYE